MKESEFRGGRGKRVEYATEMYRIPSALKPTVQNLGRQFRLLWGGLSDPTGEKLISRIEAAIPDPEQLGGDNLKPDIKYKELEDKLAELEQENKNLRSQLATAQSKYEHARKLAEDSLKLPANTGGRIKAKIREAFPELRDF